MAFHRRNDDLLAGLIFVAAGTFFAVLGQSYGLGSARSMGPGYFPTVLGIILAALGIMICIRSSGSNSPTGTIWAWKALSINFMGLIVFAVAVRGAGFLPSVFLLSLVSSWSSARFKWIPALCLASGLAIFSNLVFVVGLGLPFQTFGSWFIQ